MLQTYRAIITGDKIEWKGEGPPASHEPMPVEVTILSADRKGATASGKEMAQLLEELSKENPFSEIKDPVAWQREMRKDRPLPGRDEE